MEQSLAPLWKVTYYGGMLFDWCHPIQRGWFSTGLRCIVVSFALGITLYQLLASGFDLLQVVSKPGNLLRDCALGMAYFSTQPVVLLTWLQFLLRRRQLLVFFRDWKKLEESTTAWNVDYPTIKRIFLRANIVYFFIVTFVCSCIIFQTFSTNNARESFLAFCSLRVKSPTPVIVQNSRTTDRACAHNTFNWCFCWGKSHHTSNKESPEN